MSTLDFESIVLFDCLVVILSNLNRFELIPSLYVNKRWKRAARVSQQRENQDESDENLLPNKRLNRNRVKNPFSGHCFDQINWNLAFWGWKRGYCKGEEDTLMALSLGCGMDSYDMYKREIGRKGGMRSREYQALLGNVARCGNWEMWKFAYESPDFRLEGDQDDYCNLQSSLRGAAEGSHSELFKRIWVTYTERFLDWRTTRSRFDGGIFGALASGCIEIIQFLDSQGVDLYDPHYSNFMNARHTHMFDELIKRGALSGWDKKDPKHLRRAVLSGRFEVVKYLRKEGFEWDDKCPRDAVLNGYPEIMDWLVRNGCPFDDMAIVFSLNWLESKWIHTFQGRECPWNLACTALAARRGAKLLQFVVNQGSPLSPMVYMACFRMLSSFKFLMEKGIPFDFDVYGEAIKRTEDLQLIKYLREKGIPWDLEAVRRIALERKRTDVIS